MSRRLEDREAPVVVFDGACLLCNAGMQFIVKRDPRARFRFATLQSELGQRLAQQAGTATGGRDATMLLLEAGNVYSRSDAAFKIAGELGVTAVERWLFRALGRMGVLMPRWLRDFVYNCVARNRHRLGLTSETCWVPSDEVRRRFAS
jgi:predicted DCC family thiol-disulfide oxidoreductase YuxK